MLQGAADDSRIRPKCTHVVPEAIFGRQQLQKLAHFGDISPNLTALQFSIAVKSTKWRAISACVLKRHDDRQPSITHMKRCILIAAIESRRHCHAASFRCCILEPQLQPQKQCH